MRAVETLHHISPLETKQFSLFLEKSTSELNELFVRHPVVTYHREQARLEGASNEAIRRYLSRLGEAEKNDITKAYYEQIRRDPQHATLCLPFSNFGPKTPLRLWYQTVQATAAKDIETFASYLWQHEFGGGSAPIEQVLYPEKQHMEVALDADIDTKLFYYLEEGITSSQRPILRLMRELMIKYDRATPERMSLIAKLLQT